MKLKSALGTARHVGGSPEATLALGAAYDVVAVEDVEVVVVRHVVSVHLRVHQVVMTISGFLVQRLKWSAKKKKKRGVTMDPFTVRRSHMQTHLGL